MRLAQNELGYRTPWHGTCNWLQLVANRFMREHTPWFLLEPNTFFGGSNIRRMIEELSPLIGVSRSAVRTESQAASDRTGHETQLILAAPGVSPAHSGRPGCQKLPK